MTRARFTAAAATVIAVALAMGLAIGFNPKGTDAAEGPYYGAMPCSQWLASDDDAMRREAVRSLLQVERNNYEDSSGEMEARRASAEVVTEFEAHVERLCEKERASDPMLLQAASDAFASNKSYFAL
ncbi:hypothetical protein JK361_07070 [Streptomyces sp. 5-8]|uniref:Uncharacterized protein n=1 Tax=Streptomyces musisoli TaxID=2802280 RepID=A0ABS1NWI0_9ACTN|nr:MULTISPECIES: hypothetical protein [Streptomyces]MBL1104364.1 hypothetical protein [Streptomyces musisoli]MBY8840337.1 hypothetical protein [Streptomyces sp. SP2-10]